AHPASAGRVAGFESRPAHAPRNTTTERGKEWSAVEIFILCAAVAYMFTGKFNKDTAQAAYKAGHEPPGVVKARMRHERGGGVRTPAGTPKGRGATRLMLAQRWANACEKAKDKQDDKHRRWRAWFAEQAPQRDQQWREKQANKIAKS